MRTTPPSVRLIGSVDAAIREYVATHSGTTISGIANSILDEAVRSWEHPMITFVDGPARRRARVMGSSDVWEIIGAVRSARASEPHLSGEQILDVVVDITGTPLRAIRAAIAYWAEYPVDIDAWIDQNDADAERYQAEWERAHRLLAASSDLRL